MMTMDLKKYFDNFPFIAITRGLRAEEAISCGSVLRDAGFTIIENPLNSPDPYSSINILAKNFGDHLLVGAGTVLTVEQVARVKDAGGRLIISPNCDPAVIEAAKKCGMFSIPGVATPTEALNAIKAGADALKLFPAEILPPAALKALRAVLPPATLLIPVGSIDENNWQAYWKAGAAAFGLGSSLYNPGISPANLKKRVKAFAESWMSRQNQ
jgi:2-dehydro-3-deoxyphosphogalactonate aldolase